MHTVYEIFRELGLSGGVIVAAVYFAWRIGHTFAPLATRLAEKHVELIDSLVSQGARQTALLEGQSQILERHQEVLEHIHDAVIDRRTGRFRAHNGD